MFYIDEKRINDFYKQYPDLAEFTEEVCENCCARVRLKHYITHKMAGVYADVCFCGITPDVHVFTPRTQEYKKVLRDIIF
jgi:hypothetical protein